MTADEHQRGSARANRWMFSLMGLVIVASISIKCVPDHLWLKRQLVDIDRLEAEARRLGGSASIPPGGINSRERSIDVFLNLKGTGVGDAALARLAAMPAFRFVRSLSLERTTVTDEGLRILEGNPNLVAVNLSGSRVSDEGLNSITTLPFLTDLWLSGIQVSDAGLGILMERSDQLRLGSIDLRGTKVTADGVRSLQSAFDRLVIEHPAARHPTSNAPP